MRYLRIIYSDALLLLCRVVIEVGPVDDQPPVLILGVGRVVWPVAAFVDVVAVVEHSLSCWIERAQSIALESHTEMMRPLHELVNTAQTLW